jgi:hypothetical protein
MPPQGGWQPPQQPPQSGWQPPQQPPPGWQQGPFTQQPGPPPQKSNGVKWLLVAIAVLLVIGVSIGATLLFTRGGGGSGGPTPTTSGTPSDIASANDTGPVTIITDEPTCKTFNDINNGLGDVQKNGWADQRGALGPASDWTPDQRAQVQAVATAMRNAADQMVALAKQTPHRVVRELYEQFIVYGRAYADSIGSYTPRDDALASVNVNISSALFGICDAVENGSAARSLTLGPVDPPTRVAAPGDQASPQRFVTSSDSTCTSWIQRETKFVADTSDWEKVDSSIPGSQWTPEQRVTEEKARATLTTLANDMEAAGRQSGNPVLEDFGVLAALYVRAYVAVGDEYTSSYSWLAYTGLRLNNVVSDACRAVSG